MTDEKAPLFFLIAGEASGDALGAPLIKAIQKKTNNKARFVGVGGPRMVRAGLTTLFPQSDLAHMGLFELVKHLPLLLKRLHQTIKAAKAMNPAALISIDSPDFSFRVARALKGRGIPLIHYVAPSVWAWRAARAKKVAKFLDHLLALLPFEPPYFTKEGLACTFVGHPLIESGAGQGDAKKYGDALLLTFLAGSRKSEVSRLLPVFKETAQLLKKDFPALELAMPVVPHLRDMIADEVKTWDLPVHILDNDKDKYDAMAASRAALACSGTVSVELALARLPGIIAYKTNPMTIWIARRFIKLRYVTLVNIMQDRLVMPEFLQEDCTAEKLAPALKKLIDDEALRQEQIKDLDLVAAWLGKGQFIPSEKAADVVMQEAGLL
ncbi:MAG: lipid-A-disaccharide synthase [Alphaproteobacteria bacterium]|nr:lipid-A-disaccharide synthase [Alphaproteobacteria bacterium]